MRGGLRRAATPRALERLRAALCEAARLGHRPAPHGAAWRCSGPHRHRARERLPARARAGRRRCLRRDPRRAATRADLDERDDILSLLLQARHEDGSADERRGAARRADDAARRRPRDDRDRRSPGRSSAWCATRTRWSACARRSRRRRRVRRRRRQGDAAPAPGAADRGAPADRADARSAGTLLPAGVDRRALHLPRPPPRRTSIPSRTRFRPERFLEQPAGTYTWIPFGGGVRRCLGASFALFEMKVVLRAIVARLAAARRRRRGPSASRAARSRSRPSAAREVVVERAPARAPAAASPRPPDAAADAQGAAGAHALAADGGGRRRCSRGAGSQQRLGRRGRRGRRLHEGRLLRELREQGGALPGDARRALRRAPRGDRRASLATDDDARGPGAPGGRRLHPLPRAPTPSGSACSSSSPRTRPATRTSARSSSTRYRALRERIAERLRAAAPSELGIEPPVPLEQIALMTFAMANGFALEQLLEPEAVPDDLFGEMMVTFFTGLRARAGVPPRPAGRT